MLTDQARLDQPLGEICSESSEDLLLNGHQPETSALEKIKFSLTEVVEITLMLGQLAMPSWRLTWSAEIEEQARNYWRRMENISISGTQLGEK